MVAVLPAKQMAEEQIVAELALLGVNYLSQAASIQVDYPRPGDQLLADLVRQPSSRVRTAVIALLLEHPEYATFMSEAIIKLHGRNRMVLKLFYIAAVFLQKKYYSVLTEIQGQAFQWLSDDYSIELGIPSGLQPEEGLEVLGRRHQKLTGMAINWAGTYDNAARHLLRQKKLEQGWNR